MTLRARALAAALLLLAGAAMPGCGCSQRDALGAGTDAAVADGAAPDARAGDGPRADGPRRDGGGPDGPSWDAGTCAEPRTWQAQPRRITAVALFDGPAPRLNATERLEVEVQLQSGCEVLAAVDDLGYPGNATDFVDLAATAWVPTGACTPDAPRVTTVITIAGRQQGNVHVVVTDHNGPGGGGVRLTYDREPVTQMACLPSSPPGTVEEGGDCWTDCSCAAGLACIGYYGFIGETWSCLRPCLDLRDCDAPESCPRFVADGPQLTCLPTTDQCQGTADCPEGFTCIHADDGNFCQDQRPWATLGACACDAECPPGQHCSLFFAEPRCAAWCDRDAVCPNPAAAQVLVCGTPNVCVPLE
jgi:hypothetical protein